MGFEYMAGFAPYPGDSDRVWNEAEKTALWQRINQEEEWAREAVYLGIGECTVSAEAVFDAQKDGYIHVLYEVRRIILSIARENA